MEQLRTLLNKLFDDGQNAQYRVDHQIITFAASEEKKKADVEWAIQELKKLKILKTDYPKSNDQK
jgi:hypothetical protein